jgi:tol-pal system protein YbgF
MLTDQLNALLAVLQPPVNPADPNAPPGAGSPLGAVTLPASPSAYLNQAMADYQAGRYDLAIQGFKDVIAKFPATAAAASAQFWIAESYYQKGGKNNLREALTQYEKLITDHKESEDLPDAYLMRGVIYEDLGQRADARRMFQLVIKLYPQSPKAIQAQQRLQRN